MSINKPEINEVLSLFIEHLDHVLTVLETTLSAYQYKALKREVFGVHYYTLIQRLKAIMQEQEPGEGNKPSTPEETLC